MLNSFEAIVEGSDDDDMLDAVVSCLDYNADDMNLMDILQQNVLN